MNDHERIENELERLGLDPQWRGRYWYIRCPFHEDGHKSAQCFEDGWIHCHAGCPRKHINSISNLNVRYTSESVPSRVSRELCDFTDLWLDLEPIQDDVKGVPAGVLRKLGWREWPDNYFGIPGGYFIPYFNTDRSKVRYYQIRHTDGSDRRFTFARGCSPICYGLECLPKCKKYLTFTEGSRDSVILRMCGVPAISIPSASSGAMLRRMEQYSSEHRLILVCCGDRDDAGDKLISNITGPFIDARTPVGKDVGDFYEQKGLEEVKNYYAKYKI